MKSNITVQTFDGTTANKRDCRFIKGDFYIKNKQCFLINDTWYRVNSGFIIYDHEKKNWVISKDNPGLLKGIVGYDKEKGEAILGHFSKNSFKNVQVILKGGGSMHCMDHRILPTNLFKENTKSLMFEHVDFKGSALETDSNHKISLSRRARSTSDRYPDVDFNNHGYPFQLQYCLKHYDKSFMDEIYKAVEAERLFKTNIGKYYQQLGNLSFGMEFETNIGKIPNYRILESGLVPLRDGSITGIEFATIPLSGSNGVLVLENICSLLTTYTSISTNESLHLHIGNTHTSKKFISYLYILCCAIEKEIYSLFPAYYAQTSKFKPRGKDYNMPLKKEFVTSNLEETFANLSFYLSDGKKYQGFGSNHPSDPDGSHKWQINSR